MTTTRTINPENWSALAGTIEELLCVPGNQDLACRASNAFKQGRPGDYLPWVIAKTKRCIRLTYNGSERALAIALLDTLKAYGLHTA